MKWKGRRQSANLEDNTNTIEGIIGKATKPTYITADEYPHPVGKHFKHKKQPLPEGKDKNGKEIPAPTSAQEARDDYKPAKTSRIQVTPGKWKTKNN